MNAELSGGVNRLRSRFFILHSAFCICFEQSQIVCRIHLLHGRTECGPVRSHPQSLLHPPAAGRKKTKVALVAAMRKPVILMNRLLKNHQFQLAN